MKQFRGILIKRIDRTVEPDSKTGYPKIRLRVKVSNQIVPSHQMLREGFRD